VSTEQNSIKYNISKINNTANICVGTHKFLNGYGSIFTTATNATNDTKWIVSKSTPNEIVTNFFYDFFDWIQTVTFDDCYRYNYFNQITLYNRETTNNLISEMVPTIYDGNPLIYEGRCFHGRGYTERYFTLCNDLITTITGLHRVLKESYREVNDVVNGYIKQTDTNTYTDTNTATDTDTSINDEDKETFLIKSSSSGEATGESVESGRKKIYEIVDSVIKRIYKTQAQFEDQYAKDIIYNVTEITEKINTLFYHQQCLFEDKYKFAHAGCVAASENMKEVSRVLSDIGIINKYNTSFSHMERECKLFSTWDILHQLASWLCLVYLNLMAELLYFNAYRWSFDIIGVRYDTEEVVYKSGSNFAVPTGNPLFTFINYTRHHTESYNGSYLNPYTLNDIKYILDIHEFFSKYFVI
jgi:hypothetical protein